MKFESSPGGIQGSTRFALLNPQFCREGFRFTTRVPPPEESGPAEVGRRPASNRGVVKEGKCFLSLSFYCDAVPRHEEEGDGVDVVAGEEGVGRVNAQGS